MVAANGNVGVDDAAQRERLCEELMALLTHQRTLYRRLGVLAERQRLVDGLSGLGSRLAPYRENWTSIYNAMDGAAKRRVSELLEEANTMLGSILQRDGQDCGTLSVKRQAMADRLSATGNTRQVTAAYAAAGTGQSERMTDAQG